MKQHGAKRKERVRLFTGLGRTLIVSFLMFALIPMTVLSVIGYRNSLNSLREETEIALKTAAVLKTQEIRAYFNRMLTDLKHQAETDSSTRLLEELINAYGISGKPLETFVKSYRWAVIVDEFGSDMKKFSKAYNYHDIFLISADGDVLYSMKHENDLGTNLFTGKYSSSKFAAAVRRSVDSGKLVFSDYERYEPSENLVFGFVTYAVVNENGDRIGAMAFQFPIGPINDIMQEETGLGRTAETYLVGPDRTLRSESILDREKSLIKEKILTDQMEQMKEHFHTISAREELKHEAFTYKGPHGWPVLGVHHRLHVQDVDFGVVAEIGTEEAFSQITRLRKTMFIVVGITVIMATVLSVILARYIVRPVLFLSSGAKRVKQGDFTQNIEVKSKNEIGDLARSFNAMVESLKKTRDENSLQDWFKTGQMELSYSMRGISDLPELSSAIVTFLAKYVNAHIGALYIAHDERRLKLTGSYSFSTRNHPSNEFSFGQGPVGQAALEKQRILLTGVPEDYMVIRSGLGETTPRCLVINPFVHDDEVVGVIELGSLESFSEKALEFLDTVSENIAVTVKTTLTHIQVQGLLQKSQVQAEELEAQQEELRQSNEALTTQSAELEEKTALLETQKMEIQKRNIDLEQAKSIIEKKAKDLDAVGKYKSEFLANMSHELRTPLNSILLLSKHLSENRDGNLSKKQVECADMVHSSGNELLQLINDVLDLSKVEAGKIVLEPEYTSLKDIAGTMERDFKPLAAEKGVDFYVSVAEELPETIRTDTRRLSQVLKNLLSNAFKFTDKGSISFAIRRPDPDEIDRSKNDSITGNTIAFTVKDTGIGIPEDKHDIVFQAFNQVDGSTSRKYGGTGLGLSISRQYAALLGGFLQLSSGKEWGSVFTLYIPEIMKSQSDASRVHTAGASPINAQNKTGKAASQPMQAPERKEMNIFSSEEYVPDDRDNISPESRSILIIEDDPKFAEILRDVAKEKGFCALVAESGETGLHMTDCYSPEGIILDMGLPGIDGQAVLSRLKDNLATRHIPVHVISASDRTLAPMQSGAVGYSTKPVTMETLDRAFERIEQFHSKKMKQVLVVENENVAQEQVVSLVESDTVKVTIASTGKEVKNLINEKDFDCMILDLSLPDISGEALLSELKEQDDFHTPIIIHMARDLTSDERAMLADFAESIVIKNTKSSEKLLDETTLFLHRVEADLPEQKRKMLRMIHDREAILDNKKILIVDDDMRNVFALINILQDKGIKTVVAKNGKESLTKLMSHPDTDLVLMDIMMPEMDGYTAMEEIRRMDPEICNVPIIALTAKAMKGDRAKCIDSGADDYLSKPVDADKLLSMLRVWLY